MAGPNLGLALDTASAGTPTVRELLESRSDGRADGFKLGLAVEGGGMRGVVSGGMLLALRDLGLLNVFDSSYGTSAGAVNLSYAYAGQGWEAFQIYYDHLTAGFLRRPTDWVRRPPLDMHYGFDVVMGERIPVNWHALAVGDHPVEVVLTNVDQMRWQAFDARTLPAPQLRYLKASAWMPMFAGPPYEIDGTRFLDGGVLCADPVLAAVADGCTHVLLLNTRPLGGRNPHSPQARFTLKRALNRWQPGLGYRYVRAREDWDAVRGTFESGRSCAFGDSQVLRVAPPHGSHHVGWLTTSRGALLDGARVGYTCITSLMGMGSSAVFSILPVPG